jgi:hypothetical protein
MGRGRGHLDVDDIERFGLEGAGDLPSLPALSPLFKVTFGVPDAEDFEYELMELLTSQDNVWPKTFRERGSDSLKDTAFIVIEAESASEAQQLLEDFLDDHDLKYDDVEDTQQVR